MAVAETIAGVIRENSWIFGHCIIFVPRRTKLFPLISHMCVCNILEALRGFNSILRRVSFTPVNLQTWVQRKALDTSRVVIHPSPVGAAIPFTSQYLM